MLQSTFFRRLNGRCAETKLLVQQIVVETHDVIRNSLANYYAREFLKDDTLIENSRTALIVSGFFALVCWISSLTLVPVLSFWLRHQVQHKRAEK
jgi:hypothetical protein